MKEFGETKESGAEYTKRGGTNEIEKAKGKGSSGKEAKLREGLSKDKKVEEKNVRVEGKKGWITHYGKKCDGKKSDGRRSEFKEGSDNREKPFN